MPLEKLLGSVVVNHADNFFAVSVSSDDAADVSKALKSAIAVLPGGDFQSKDGTRSAVKDGFRMLGCWVSLSKTGHWEVEPTEANLKDLRKRAYRQRQSAPCDDKLATLVILLLFSFHLAFLASRKPLAFYRDDKAKAFLNHSLLALVR